MADNGIITKKSAHSVADTLDKLTQIVEEKGFNVFARVEHAKGAAKAGLTMNDAALLIFGNPQGGTPLMQSAILAGLDLPLKAFAYADDAGQVWLAYNDPAYIASRHGINDRAELIEKMSAGLNAITDAATAA